MFDIKDGVVLPAFVDSIPFEYSEKTHSYTNVISMKDASSDKPFNTLEDAKKESSGIKELIVVLEATHEGETLNYTRYHGKNMENSAHTWTSPFEKPVLPHHNTHADALGRVKKAEFGESKNYPGIKTIFLTLSITESEAIQKFLDGRYTTVSIGGRAKELKCGVCGTDLLNDKFCGHWLGNTYSYKAKEEEEAKKVVCYWDIGDMEYTEVSVVNKPADAKQAAPTSMSEGDGTGNPVNPEDSEGEAPATVKDSADLNELDRFLDGQGTTEESKTPSEGTEDGACEGDDNPGEGTEDGAEGTKDTAKTEEGTADEETVESLQGKVSALQEEMEALKVSIKALEDENKTLEDKNSTLEADLADSKSDLEFRSKQSIRLMKEFKKELSSSIVALKESYRIATDADTVDAFSQKSISDLRDDLGTLLKKITDGEIRKEIKPVSSPGIVDNKNTQGVENEQEDGTKVVNLATVINEIVKKK